MAPWFTFLNLSSLLGTPDAIVYRLEPSVSYPGPQRHGFSSRNFHRTYGLVDSWPLGLSGRFGFEWCLWCDAIFVDFFNCLPRQRYRDRSRRSHNIIVDILNKSVINLNMCIRIIWSHKENYMNIYVYIYTYVHTYIHTYMHTYIRTYIHTKTHRQICQRLRFIAFFVVVHQWHYRFPCRCRW